MTPAILHLGPLGLGLGAAIVFDLRRRRIPNVICAFVLLSAIVVRLIDQGGGAVLQGLGAAALVVAALYRPWIAGGIGGGDVKLAAATAAWIPFARLPWFALSAALAGGLVALVNYQLAQAEAKAEIRANLTLMVLQGDLPTVPSHRSKHRGVPYGVAIACGAVLALLCDAWPKV
ncbi:MAG TPA: prepilin peptidase [Polyangia bacterium]|jgi:prepilin peptidase CpaA|nr:prepilin peptidase [Polyangia bacterium]